MSPIQSNTQEGLIVLVANSDLTGKEGYLAKIVDGSGPAKADLAGNGVLAPYVIEEGGASGSNVVLRPLVPGRQVRIVSSGTIAGAVIVASDVNGKIEAASTGDYAIGITEEDSAAGNYTLVRPAFHVAK